VMMSLSRLLKKAFNSAERRRNRLRHQGKSMTCEIGWGRHSAHKR